MEITSPLVIGFIGAFFLLAVVSLTAFAKISVVLMILRNALGLQQVPSNMIVMSLAVFLAIFISMPPMTASANAILSSGLSFSTADEMMELWTLGIQPFREFMQAHTMPEHIGFFVDAANEVWAGSGLVATTDMFILEVPAFMVTELTHAFEVGFLIYLPFVAVDLAVTGILMALGMQMVQPNIIATPFKLLLFVSVDGWSRIIEGLILTYAV